MKHRQGHRIQDAAYFWKVLHFELSFEKRQNSTLGLLIHGEYFY